MKGRTTVTAFVVLVAIGGLAPLSATAQFRRGWVPPVEQGGAPPPPYGYPGPAYPAPPGGYGAPGGYGTPGAYAAPGGGYPPAGYATPGYPAPGYPPPPYQPPVTYPQQGQSPQQATNDQNECGTWAAQQTGFDPNAPATGTNPSGSQITGLFGGVERRQERREFRRQQWEGQTEVTSQQDGYGRALNACLSARGYTVR